jgi:CheY-like chemotaxis protein
MGRKILVDAGYEVIAVNNGSAALKKIAELKPDLVILDVYMPGYSGLEVCQRLKESQESARIPVLLSVGKLEPFKPEEAQRVRADGYIVKPFEASELLSALSKLEDKVVPRAEPSKPGRFARAIAAAEESSRGSGKDTANERNGWKSRIGFPHEKTELAEKIVDESAIYNPMNRDLRTVVETAGEKAAEQAATEEKQRQTDAAAESSVDVAALAPAGLPKDVTPEEVAAIAAAAAQIQMANAALKDEHQVSEAQVSEAQVSEAQVIPAVEDNIPALPDESASVAKEEVQTQPTAESKVEGVAEFAVAGAGHLRSDDETPQETQDEPVTMAAASAETARWTAVPVALEGEEASISLEQEMQKAYAAFAGAEADSIAVSVPEAQAVSAENSSAPADAAVEEPVAAISQAEAEPVPEPEPTVSAEAMPAETAAVAQLEMASASFEAAVPAPEAVEVAPAEASAETLPNSVSAETHAEPTPVQFMSPVSEAEVAGLAGLVGLGAETQLAPTAEVAIAEATPVAAEPEPVAAIAEYAAEDAAQPNPDPETVKSTAAAWASWRQIRDTTPTIEATPPQSKEFEVPQSVPAETAMAVAAGAEQIQQEVPAAAPDSSPADVASIVDSVLADLRPKLMAEISRKMAEKK